MINVIIELNGGKEIFSPFFVFQHNILEKINYL